MQVTLPVAFSRRGFEQCNQGGQVRGETREAASFSIQPGLQDHDQEGW